MYRKNIILEHFIVFHQILETICGEIVTESILLFASMQLTMEQHVFITGTHNCSAGIINIAQCAVCKVYFSAKPNKLKPILNFQKYYPI